MRLDVVTIFPDYLRVLELSLIGKAAGTGLIDLAVHDLRRWAHDRHRTVDDTPLGGGAGMVMRPDVWGEALDTVLDLPAERAAAREAATGRRRAGTRQVLVVPTPAGEVFTQRTAEDLAHADQVVFACGRYEGIDARVPEHYRQLGVEVRELSIGDYVLNGGEVAALVIIEAVARLRPGVLGNPDSVVEESHSRAGLLEYPVHTRPVSWRGHDLATSWPGLLSGNHPRVARERRERAIARTADRRPDMVARLDAQHLDGKDRAALAHNGWAVPRGAAHPVPLSLRRALAEDVPGLVVLARRTFPDACPSFLTTEQVTEHMDRHLTAERLGAWQADPRVIVTLACLTEDTPAEAGPVRAGEPVGYSVVILEAEDDAGALPAGLDPRPAAVNVPHRPAGGPGLAAELSKVYVDARLRGSGLVDVLLSEAVRGACALGVTTLWLGTHDGNRRAHKAYRRSGFVKVGTRRYDVGGQSCRDVVMTLSPGACDPQQPVWSGR
ncbi:tRNA (guanosine(37)-N1)-methyltransferase TrmD [Actinomyces sp. W5033]|uniref:tRNA (guanosine(37)-N1)-methyltransferase TrmD n=1 Tax=Actinomyces sp. W5033 TaxID=3446479 RepID=UPI003EE24947